MCKKLTTEEFIRRAKEVHGDTYDYSLTKYTSSLKKVEIICPIHHIFNQIAGNHMKGGGCKKCATQTTAKNRSSNTEEFIKRAIEVHGDTYDYGLTTYIRKRDKVIIQCKVHGEFRQKPYAHLAPQGCPICKNSKGEIYIRNYLISNGIQYEVQKTFPNCKYIYKLRFDFYLPTYNLLIEFQGRQHYVSVETFGNIKGLETMKRNDQIKRDFTTTNKINLLEISFENIDSIESILDSYLKTMPV